MTLADVPPRPHERFARLCRKVRWQQPEPLPTRADDRPEVPLVEREQIERAMPLGEHNDRRVRQPEPEVRVSIEDRSRSIEVVSVERLELVRAVRDLGEEAVLGFR